MKTKNGKQQSEEKIKVENLAVPRFYYNYFPFKKDLLAGFFRTFGATFGKKTQKYCEILYLCFN